MKQTIRLLFAALPIVLGLASCVNDGIDNPVAPSGPEADKYVFTDEMDLSVAPGDDFYQYVLGTWLDENLRSQVGPKGMNHGDRFLILS